MYDPNKKICMCESLISSLQDPKISSPFGNIKKEKRGVSNESKLRRWKHRTQISHHLLMLMLQVILNTLNPLLEILKLRSEASLILIHTILHRVETCIIDHNKFLHASAKRDDLSR